MSRERRMVVVLSGLAILLSVSAHSEPIKRHYTAADAEKLGKKRDPNYFNIGNVTVSHAMIDQGDLNSDTPYIVDTSPTIAIDNTPFITPQTGGPKASPTPSKGNSGLGDWIGELGDLASGAQDIEEGPLGIADLLLKVWDIIEANKPVVNVQTKIATALPNIAKNNWTVLTGWQSPRGVQLSLDVQNLYGMHVVQLIYGVNLQYGGSVKGKGKYIATAQVLPTKVNVLWGFDLDVQVEVVSVVNAGTTANPLAEITLDVTYTYGSVLGKTSRANRYLLTGDGHIQNLDTGEQYY